MITVKDPGNSGKRTVYVDKPVDGSAAADNPQVSQLSFFNHKPIRKDSI
jgi:hypothetical protein